MRVLPKVRGPPSRNRLEKDLDTVNSGQWEEIDGVKTYVATPTKDYPKDKAILFLPDVFGPQLINAQVCESVFIRMAELIAQK